MCNDYSEETQILNTEDSSYLILYEMYQPTCIRNKYIYVKGKDFIEKRLLSVIDKEKPKT